MGYVLQFLATFVPTILVEGILLLLFGYGTQRRNWLRFLTVNLLTQGTLALAMAYSAMQHGVTGWSLLPFIFMEILIIHKQLYQKSYVKNNDNIICSADCEVVLCR